MGNQPHLGALRAEGPTAVSVEFQLRGRRVASMGSYGQRRACGKTRLAPKHRFTKSQQQPAAR